MFGNKEVASFGLGGQWPPLIFFFKNIIIIIYMCVLILAILFYKITFFPLNNIIDSFKSNVILTNFLQHFYKLFC